MSTLNIIKQGAEAKLYSTNFLGRKTIIKERFKKKYRHPELDERLTKERIRSEIRGILRSKMIGVKTPAIYFVDSKKNSIYMEYIEDVYTINQCIGHILKMDNSQSKNADNNKDHQNKNLKTLASQLGKIIGKLHKGDIIHGDLTTSNILIKDSFPFTSDKIELTIIDFGLSHIDSTTEGKGVDLYVLERALISTHSSIPWFFEILLESYRLENKTKDGEEVFKKLEEIRLRGRKRTMVG